MIATVRDMATNTKLTMVLELCMHYDKGFKQNYQVQRFSPPKWDINLVLCALTKTPYDPLAMTPVDDLTSKTAFLIGFTIAAQIYERHTLDISMVCFRLQDTAVHFFLAKNQMSDQFSQTYIVQLLSSIMGEHDMKDPSMCPVQALKHYVDRTCRIGKDIFNQDFLQGHL